MKPEPLDKEAINLWKRDFYLAVALYRANETIRELKKTGHSKILGVKIPEKKEKAVDIYITKIKQRIKSACEFWLENKDNPTIFISEYPKYKKDLDKLLGKLWEPQLTNPVRRDQLNLKYNEWLFKLAFKDVLE